MERIQKVIALSGYASRRHAEELIKQGKVYVNGEKVTEMGLKVSGEDVITIDGKILSREEKVYFILNKPRGVVTTAKDEKNRKNVVDLIKTDKRIYPVGRLDYDTTGLLILTNDGELANLLMHPKSNIDKTYIAKIRGIFTSKDAIKISKGVNYDNILTAPAKVKIKKIDRLNNCSIVEITIHEGRNHQVKNMFKALSFEVLKLKRERYAFIDLGTLLPGEYRALSIKEVKKLYNEVQKKDII